MSVLHAEQEERQLDPPPPALPVVGRQMAWVAGIIAIPAVILVVAAAARYLNGQSSIDTVIFDQGLWALSQGHAPLSTVIRENLLEDHFGPALLGFAALYRLAATPLWLIVGQVVAASAAVWMIARSLVPALGAKRAGLLGAALLASPPVAYALLFDVHAVVFAAPFAVGAVLAVEKGAPRRALVFGLLAALFRIEVGLAVLVALAVWPGSRKGRLVPGLLLTAYLIVAFHFENALGHDSHWTPHYGYLGASAGDALAHPWRVARALLSPATLAKPLPWLATGAFFAVRRPRLMIPAALAALPILLSNWPGTGGIVYQYGFAPTLLLALAWVPVLRERPERANFVIAACLMLAVLLGPFSPGLPSSNSMQGFLGQYLVPHSDLSCISKGIPDDAVVSGSRPITLIAHRRELYLWPYPFGGVPANMLPGSYLSTGDPRVAARVDYLLVGRDDDTAPIPPGFVADGSSPDHLRYRRLDSTVPDPVTCR